VGDVPEATAKRMQRLLADRKASDREASTQRAIAATCLQEFRKHPALFAEVAPKIYVAAANAAAGDLLIADSLPEVLSQLGPAAAAWIFADVERAWILVELARRPAKLAELVALADTDQAVRLGAFVAELEAARRPIAQLYGSAP
jgi:hypothetical protein